MRLINADELEDKVADLYTEGEEATEADKVVNDVIDLIDNAPTIDVVKAYNIIARGKSKDCMLLGGFEDEI